METYRLKHSTTGLKLSVRYRELLALAIILMLLNLQQLGVPVSSQHLDLQAISQGEWWRWFTHPFVHVSSYHLFIDGFVFAALWPLLPKNTAERWWIAGLCTVGSLLGVFIWSPEVRELGYCGLSGLCHGLAVWVGLQMASSSRQKLKKIVGAIFVLGLLTKVSVEYGTNLSALERAHWGDVGVPLVGSHLGGVLAGLAVFGTGWLRRKLLADIHCTAVV